ncbi:MAG TPA: hypothetical protein VFU63_00815 [Ktedonobacterales bacterium]|nr:hypothetical protein [Ktedonobacterales bacterium]
MPFLPFLPPTRPLLIWAAVALACAVVLAVEGILLLSGRTRQVRGWRFGIFLLLGSLVAVALAARLYDIHAELIRVRCNCEPFQWTEPDLATPLILGTVLGSVGLAFTVFGSVRTLRFFRSPTAPDVERSIAREPLGGYFVLAFLAGAGVWISANALVRLAETAYLIDPVRQGDGLGIIPLYEAAASSLCGALLLIVPLTILLSALYRSRRARS